MRVSSLTSCLLCASFSTCFVAQRKESPILRLYAGSTHSRPPISDSQGSKRARTPEPIKVGRRIFVGNLSFRVGWQDLKDQFKSCGNVVFAKILQGPDGRSKGCGIVEFETSHEAADAINAFHDTELDGRIIFIREDREDFELKESRPKQRRRSDGPARPRSVTRQEGTVRPSGAPSVSSIFVNNLAWTTSAQDLETHFGQCGDVTEAILMKLPDGRSKGCGLVTFASTEDAQAAIHEMNNSMLDGREVFVRADREQDNEDPTPQSSYVRTGGRSARIQVKNLNYATAWQGLKDFFNVNNEVLRADILLDDRGRSSGQGIVTFHSADAAELAIQTFNGTDLDGRPLQIQLS